MGVGGRNADFLFSGKAAKLTKASQFREIICKPVLDHISSSILPRAFVAEDSYMVISISKKHTVSSKQKKPAEFSSALPAFPRPHLLALGRRGQSPLGASGREGLPGW